MAHTDKNKDQIIKNLAAHREKIQQLIEQLEDGVSCGALLTEVHQCYSNLGSMCADLAMDHLQHHIVEESESSKRIEGANEVVPLLQGLLK